MRPGKRRRWRGRYWHDDDASRSRSPAERARNDHLLQAIEDTVGMKIGIIGAGNVGTGLGKRLAVHGHDIMVSFARSPDKVRTAAMTIGAGARAGSPEEAVAHGEVVIIATPWAVTLEAVRSVATGLDGKIVWDATNPLKGDMSGLAIGTSTSGGEEISRAVPGAHIVKAVPPFAEVLHSDSMEIAGQLPSVFVCSDNGDARKTIVDLVGQIPATAVEAGPLSLARYSEPLGMLLVQLAYAQGMGARIGASLIR
ncbi:NADPH-dependent F420 reductase [Qipengyuania qiaonensis]|uniref:NAD(P)-binding domain-containing protein n=1 Tax=Qipengyuania qiaonensis TaxID=2867240 RepID=A0ABS7J916_9SPHN|nr:NAD(P)-binding domain-containing protein [Qipengyuania qiaonensis]MBX7483797.1 NAD(P)-binding domain-containing protein [Qipengyuania qiaonensis]